MRRSPSWYLRVATSVTSLTVCLLLIAFWVRSYWWLDNRLREVGSNFGVFVHSQQGQLRFILITRPPDSIDDFSDMSMGMELFRETFALPNSPHRIPAAWPARVSKLWEFDGTYNSDGLKVVAPHWFAAAFFGLIAGVL